MRTLLKNAGQVGAGLILATAILTTAGSWVVSHILNSPEQLSASVASLETKVAVLETSDNTTQSTIKEMKDNIEYIRRSIEEQNRRQGITISTIKQ